MKIVWKGCVPSLTLGLVLATQTGCALWPQSESPSVASSIFGSGKPAAGPENGPSFNMRLADGRNLENANDLDKAREVYEELVREYPNRFEAYHRLGVVADRQRRHGEAQEWFAKALQLEPRNAELLNDLGYCFYLQGKLNKAESALLKAVTLEDRNPRYRNNLGMVYGHLDRHAEALDEFRKAGSEADALYNLAFIYASQGNDQKSQVCFQQALTVNPDHQLAREALDAIERHEYIADSTGTDGRRMVPFKESGETAQVGFEGSDGSVTAGQARQAGGVAQGINLSRNRRDLHDQARDLLQRRMASQRDDSQRQ